MGSKSLPNFIFYHVPSMLWFRMSVISGRPDALQYVDK
jgi:hypothetical protein